MGFEPTCVINHCPQFPRKIVILADVHHAFKASPESLGVVRRFYQYQPATYLLSGKVKMSSHLKPLWSYGESNSGPLPCHGSALPTELQPQASCMTCHDPGLIF